MKKSAYKGRGGSSFRTYFRGNKKVNGCSFRQTKRDHGISLPRKERAGAP